MSDLAFVDQSSRFHCPCGKTHGRGPLNGVDVYRCLKCGRAYRVRGVVELRPKLISHEEVERGLDEALKDD